MCNLWLKGIEPQSAQSPSTNSGRQHKGSQRKK
jgi:hypothetical protein